MVKLYVLKIQRGELTIEDVPQYWRDKVETALDAKNNTEDGE